MLKTTQTIIEQTVKEQVDNLLLEKPEFATTLYRALKNIKTRFYRSDLVYAIFQKNRQEHDIYETFCFLKIWSDILLGQILTARVHIFDNPQRNDNIAGNNAALSKLVFPFKAEFIPAHAGDDGYFQWLTDIELQQEIRDLKDYKGNKSKSTHIKVPPSRIPLEVGYTSAQKTYEYLYMITGALARFPYESDEIFIFYNYKFKSDGNDSMTDQ